MVTTAQRYRVWNCDRCGGARAGDEPHYCQPVDSPLSAEQQEQSGRASEITEAEQDVARAAESFVAAKRAYNDATFKELESANGLANRARTMQTNLFAAVDRLIAVRGE